MKTNLSKILEEELLQKMQSKYRVELPIHLGGGWIPLVVEFLEKLGNLPFFESVQLEQIKEKFGSLRIYYNSTSWKTLSEEQHKIIDHLIDECEEQTSKTCYFCGKPGKMNTIKFFVCVRCEACTRDQE